MALLFSCGFDQFADQAGMSDLFSTVQAATTLETSGGAFGGQFTRISVASTALEFGLPAASAARGGTSNVFHLSFWIRCLTYSATADEALVRIEDTAEGDFVELEIVNPGGELEVTEWASGSGSLGVSSTSVTDGDWHHVELAFVADNTSGVAKLWIDGNLEVDVSGDTTGFGGNISTTGIDNLDWRSDDMEIDIDDLLVWDEEGTGLVESGQLGPHRIELKTPTADGNSEDWTLSTGTDAYALLDEDSAASAADYVETSTLDDQMLFELSASGFGNPQTIHGVALHTRAAFTGAGTPELNGRVRSGTSEADAEGGTMVLTGTQADYVRWVDTDPDTASAWADVAAIDAAEFGFDAQVVGDTARVIQFYAEAVTSSASALPPLDADVNRSSASLVL